MNFIRLIDQNNPPEFFKDDLPLVFLGALRNINIFVGANNSRKSRFLRHVIQQEHKVLINYEGDLNKLYWTGKELLVDSAKIPKEVWQDPWLAIRIDRLEDKNEREKHIKAFFHRKTGENIIDALTLRTHIEELVSTLLNMAVPDNFASFYTILDNLYATVTMGVEVYDRIQSFQGKNMTSNTLTTFQRHIEATFPGINPGEKVPFWQERLQLLKKVLTFADELRKITVGPTHPYVTYLPVLRSARKLEESSDKIFEQTLRKQYRIQTDSKLTIETGLDLYEKVGLARNGSRSEIQDFHAFEQFIGDTFFQGKPIHIIARRSTSTESQHLHISLPDEREDVTIQELGDGVQGVISLLFPIFTAKSNSWILIDEPENHLHPGYQLILIQALASNPSLIAKNLTFFINTHSNHILSESFLSKAGLEVFVFNKKDKDSSDIKSIIGQEHSTLKMLGVLNTSVLISNCTVWVEGITDRLYVKAFLHAYLQSLSHDSYRPHEGLNYSFVEYGGKNLSHYDFESDSIGYQDIIQEINTVFHNANVFLLADHDGKDEKHKAYEAIIRPNFVYQHTELPEIENLIPTQIWKNYLLEEVGVDPETIAKIVAIESVQQKLGAYFQKIIKKKGSSVAIEKKQGGGTLAYPYKKGIAEYVYHKVISGDITWEHLSQSSVLNHIVEKLYKFIESRNKRV